MKNKTAHISFVFPAIPFYAEGNAVVYACAIGLIEALVRNFM